MRSVAIPFGDSDVPGLVIDVFSEQPINMAHNATVLMRFFMMYPACSWVAV